MPWRLIILNIDFAVLFVVISPSNLGYSQVRTAGTHNPGLSGPVLLPRRGYSDAGPPFEKCVHGNYEIEVVPVNQEALRADGREAMTSDAHK